MVHHNHRNALWAAAGILAVVALAALDLACGSGGFHWPEGVLLWKLRGPRVVTAILAGAALAVSGAQMQAVFRNPLADPHIMGVSGGAGLGAALATMGLSAIGGAVVHGGIHLTALWSGAGIAAAAFAGAAGASLLIIWASGRVRGTTVLLLFGVMLGFVFSAISSILQDLANEESLQLFYSWAAGSYAGNSASGLALMAGALAVGTGLALANQKGLDLLLFGEEYATLGGAPVRHIRTLAMLSTCLMTGAVTAFCGPVGFVGIIAPHLVRRLSRSARHGVVLPGSLLAGAALSLAADALSQCGPVPIPVGSTMALIGIPFILVILFRKP